MIDNRVEEVRKLMSKVMEVLDIEINDGTENTALRIAKMYCNELFENRNNHNIAKLDASMKYFDIEGDNGSDTKPIIVKDMPFTSMCFTGKTPVRMKEGVKYIRDVKVGDIAVTFDEEGNIVEKPVTHVMKRKTSNTVKVHISNGKTLRCTPEHPFFVEDRGWVEAKNLEPHDTVRVFNGRHFPSASTWDYTINEGYDFGYVLGVIASDGSTWRNQTRLEVNDINFAKTFVKSLKTAFNLEGKIVKSEYTSGFTPKKFPHRNLIRIISGYFVEYLKEVFSGSTGSKEFVFPEIVLNSFESFEGFIHGYYAGDGDHRVDRSSASIITANKVFAKTLSDIFDSSLINTSVRGVYSVSIPLHIMGFHKLEIYKTRFREKFESEYKNIVPIKINPLMKSAEIIDVEDLPMYSVNVYNFEVKDNHTYLASDIWVHNCEHHWLPFYGVATVQYTPSNKIVGLSKIPRVVRYFSKRPQLQERYTKDIGMYLVDALEPKYLSVLVTAKHECVMCRGIESDCVTDTHFEWRA